MNYFLPAIVAKSLPVFIAVSVNFLTYLLLKFVPVFIAVFNNFLPYLSPKFRAKDKNPKPFTYCNWIRTHNHLVHKRTLNHLAKLAK